MSGCMLARSPRGIHTPPLPFPTTGYSSTSGVPVVPVPEPGPFSRISWLGRHLPGRREIDMDDRTSDATGWSPSLGSFGRVLGSFVYCCYRRRLFLAPPNAEGRAAIHRLRRWRRERGQRRVLCFGA